MSNKRVMVIYLIFGLIKKTLHKISQHFSKQYEPVGGGINVKVDLSNYATKTDLRKSNRNWYIQFRIKTKLC